MKESTVAKLICACLMMFLGAALVAEYIPAMLILFFIGLVCYELAWIGSGNSKLFNFIKALYAKEDKPTKKREHDKSWDYCYYTALVSQIENKNQ